MAMFTRILVPVDGSKPSDAAVDLAIRFAAEERAQIGYVYVCDPARIAAATSAAGVPSVDPSFAIDAERAYGSEVLQEAVRKTTERGGIQETAFLEEGGCVESILEVADGWKADLIIVGSHGRSGIARALLGSVAEGLLRHAHIPVLVAHVRDRAPAPEAPAPLPAAEQSGAEHEVDPVC